ncbi:hypothetical protein BU23DRAFT_131518 [Bimuria novae-zelandiae CBS 107.79]|uniref:Uncharacterized protein n=1 Tax=Bimuria novae-zelandiae CBS 107.79 TaxID=1447943 RepID=A0A6A5V9D8_9PLEO|nr:hypothetical protein BU23DRAFT_131518 [Bimuria novae-zelandiae CBS 107.79]
MRHLCGLSTILPLWRWCGPWHIKQSVRRGRATYLNLFTDSPAGRYTKIASCDTCSLPPSLPMKFVPYVPPARTRKPKPKSKAGAKATTRTAGYDRTEADSFKVGGEWFDIDNFLVPDSNTSRSFDPGVPAPFRDADSSDSGSLDQGTTHH